MVQRQIAAPGVGKRLFLSVLLQKFGFLDAPILATPMHTSYQHITPMLHPSSRPPQTFAPQAKSQPAAHSRIQASVLQTTNKNGSPPLLKQPNDHAVYGLQDVLHVRPLELDSP